MKESTVVNAIMRYLKSVPACFAWKEHGGMYGTAGLPDVICCYRGRFVAFEVKVPAEGSRPGGKLTKLQEATLRKIKEAKGEAHKVTSVKEVQMILSTLEVHTCENSLDIP